MPNPKEKPWEFQELVAREFECLHRDKSKEPNPGGQNPRDFWVSKAGAADEPWIAFTRHDHLGLALSGGGIRSATFNLGLLQGIDRNDLLKYVDYVSTVSGGGYVGGFWAAWLKDRWQKPMAELKALQQEEGKAREEANKLKGEEREKKLREAEDLERKAKELLKPLEQVFPRQQEFVDRPGPAEEKPVGRIRDIREPAEIRHLREFSRFLMPRVGFAQSETWSGIVTILGGMIPSLIGTAALILLLVYAWFGASYALIAWEPIPTAVIFGIVTIAGHAWFEQSWKASGKAGEAAKQAKGEAGTLILLTGFASAICWWLWRISPLANENPELLRLARQYWRGHRMEPGTALPSHLLLFGPALVWAAVAVVLIIVRFVRSRRQRPRWELLLSTAAMDRCAARCLAPAVVCAVMGVCWEASRWLYAEGSAWRAPTGGTVVFGGLFLWCRNWLLAPIKETRGTQYLQRLAVMVKPLAPQLLAAAAVLSFVIGMTMLVQVHGLHRVSWHFYAGTALAVQAAILFLFNPSIVGMHDFYRGRIARCFLGAAHAQNSKTNHATFEQETDDFNLCDEQGHKSNPGQPAQSHFPYPGGPIHLVCCAANNLGGDTLRSLYRGCRSAVLSRHGVSLGSFTGRLPGVRFSSALTASAAAFNSQMGRVSMRLGPAVAIVMSALNLRLGLWVPHPGNSSRGQADFPGRFFLYEMFGLTRAEDSGTRKEADDVASKSRPERFLTWFSPSSFLHLSDGGHFENLGLYELIRRHCRYIIVSDASADPNVDFDDLANALRCVREDFGVEIDVDVAPLRPSGDSNRSSQHAVVGTIHYDGLTGTDKGTLLYFKPTLTGDESPDVLQYQARNRAFPHESTGDQFYDEAQWESYRRLGEHAANVVLRFLQTEGHKSTSFVENTFLGVSQRWHPAPPLQEESFLELTERCAALESKVLEDAPVSLREEFFPEVVASKPPANTPAGAGPEKTKPQRDETQVVYYVMLAAQVMEDAWLGLKLDDYWSHPLNQGWMNYFQRWASTASFRRWWPIVRPIYSAGFADFVKERFNIRLQDPKARPTQPEGPGASLTLSEKPIRADTDMDGLAWQAWLARFPDPGPIREGREILTYNLKLEPFAEDGGNHVAKCMQVGFLIFQRDPTKKQIEWKTPHFFVPYTLIGAGIMARFLDALLVRFEDEKVREIRVTLEEDFVNPRKTEDGKSREFRPDPASRLERVRTINFYKSRGFVYMEPGEDGLLRTLSLTLPRP